PTWQEAPAVPTGPVCTRSGSEPNPSGSGCSKRPDCRSQSVALPVWLVPPHSTMLTTTPGVKPSQATVTVCPSTSPVAGTTVACSDRATVVGVGSLTFGPEATNLSERPLTAVWRPAR